MIRRKDRGNVGFTLIEVLVATFILIVMVMILSKVFHQASVAWSAGYRRADGNMSGRAAVGFMARELMNAVADEEYLNDISIKNGSSISFISLTGENASGQRAARRITYTGGGSLTRTEETATSGSYGGFGGGTSETLAKDISSVEFFVDGTYDHADIPSWVRMRITVDRSADVSGVGASSSGPDGSEGTEDDIRSW